MTNRWRPLAIAAALNVIVCAGVAKAQTVAVTNAPAGAHIEVQVIQKSGESVTGGTADQSGIGSVPLKLEGKLDASGMDANIYLDICGTTRRVIILERGAQLHPPSEGCDRRDVTGLYWVRPINTIVVNTNQTTPSVLLIKGSYTPRPPSEEEAAPSRPRRLAPTGLAFYGGAGLLTFANATSVACGNVTACTGDQSGIGFSVGGVYWVTHLIGLEGGYIRPPKAKASADAAPLHFNSTLDADVVRIVGDVGIPAGPVRIYGLAGGIYHQATTTTTQTIDPQTITVDGVQQTVPGGTQTFGLRTQGWSWTFGGGAEIWTSNRFAIYGEIALSKLKGNATAGAEGSLDDRVSSLIAGARIRIGKK